MSESDVDDWKRRLRDLLKRTGGNPTPEQIAADKKLAIDLGIEVFAATLNDVRRIADALDRIASRVP